MIINWLQEIWCEYEADLHSNKHFLSSVENKTWKNFHACTTRDLNAWPLQYRFFFSFRPYFHYCSGSVHYSKDHFNSCLYPQFTYMIFTVIYSSLNRFIWNQHNDQLPVGLLAQLVKSHTGLNFFQTLFSLQLRQCSLLQRSPSHSSLYPQFTYMIFIYSQSRNLVLGQANNFF